MCKKPYLSERVAIIVIIVPEFRLPYCSHHQGLQVVVLWCPEVGLLVGGAGSHQSSFSCRPEYTLMVLSQSSNRHVKDPTPCNE